MNHTIAESRLFNFLFANCVSTSVCEEDEDSKAENDLYINPLKEKVLNMGKESSLSLVPVAHAQKKSGRFFFCFLRFNKIKANGAS